jgi:hypothetical protein
MPSVTTSAPTMEALSQQATDSNRPNAFERHDPPPPPTIMPDLDAEPTPTLTMATAETEIDIEIDAMPGADLSPMGSVIDAMSDPTSADEDPASSSRGQVPFDLEPANLPLELVPSTAPLDLDPDPRPFELGRSVEATAPPMDADLEESHPTSSRTGDEPEALPLVGSQREIPSALVEALDKLPFTPEQRRRLAETAIVESLSFEEDVSVACLALVIEGQASAQATVSDVTAVAIRRGELLYAKSSIEDSLSLRLVAETDPTTIALWDLRAEDVLADTPDLVDRLKRASDRTQAIAGCTMGPLGEQLDEGLRAVALDHLEVRILSANEVIAPKGQPVPGMVIIGVGTVEIESDNGEPDRLGPGDFLFATEVLGGGPAPATARAGTKGAIVLFGARAAAHELLVTCPPLLEVFAGM